MLVYLALGGIDVFSRQLMHVNDSFFWMVIGFSRMETATGYRTLTVIMAVMGIVALIIIALIGPILLGH